MAMSQYLPRTEPEDLCMIEVIGRDGLVHHLGPFKSREVAEAWIAQNAAPQCCNDQEHTLLNDARARDRKSGLSTV
jgi:hypothetical protein